MASATSDAFLSGRGVAVDVNAVEAELAKLWGPAAEQAGGPELENPTVTRIVLANLVVAATAGQRAWIDEVLDTVVARYPCRTIVLEPSDDGERRVRAEVSALCHLPAPGQPQVCSERILLSAGPNALDLLPGAVRPLLESDLPFVLWWTGDPRTLEPLFRDLADECTRLLLGLADPDGGPEALRLGLDPRLNPFARDIAWFGITRWRELVAQFFDLPCSRDAWKRITAVRIEALAPRAEGVPRVAIWLAAWLAGQLGWKPDTLRAPAPGRREATFHGPSGPIAIEIAAGVEFGLRLAQVTRVLLTVQEDEGPAELRLIRSGPGSADVRVEVESTGRCPLPSFVHAPEIDAARRVAAALESSRTDPPFERALPIALWLMEV